ncbi:cytochrome P450 [Lentzea sp. BCCO 10_0798]|uniref:Cytochrome P450 n=1 Tax=Lentzea kristufekii TaxID=3095430 RepID=A0ABU4TPG1_9PSEU|nr:cytochrome P450 [Lentzea sp. BCCO 10_0798]MDX8050156.1 cytochrome P450 [Lentzea sp. BCCO 10_0798]
MSNLLTGGDLRARDHHRIEDDAREEGPLHPVTLPNGVRMQVVTVGLELTRQLLADQRLSKDSAKLQREIKRQLAERGSAQENLAGLFGPSMLNSDNPQHARLRALAVKAFNGKAVQQLAPRIEEICAELVAGLPENEEIDLVEELTVPMPMHVIGEVLGLPAQDRAHVRTLIETMMSMEPEVSQPASDELGGYFHALLTGDGLDPRSLFGVLALAADDDGDHLSHDELMAMAFLLVVAGHETSAGLIANVVHDALDNGLWHEVAEDPELVPRLVEETLRHNSPVRSATHRIATEPVEIGGTTIPANTLLLINLGAAGRCPQAHEKAGEYRLDRETTGHATFGHGPHFCLGSALARLETETVLRQLTSRFPRTVYAGDGQPEVTHNDIMASLKSLPVVLRR